MKKILVLLTLILVLTTSCKNQEVKKLNNRIIELEKMNLTLQDSIKNIELQRIISSELIGISEKTIISPNQNNQFTFLFSQTQNLPKYNVYRVIKNDTNVTRKLIVKNLTKSRFKYNFIPKDENDSSFDLIAEFHIDDITIEIPASIDMNLDK